MKMLLLYLYIIASSIDQPQKSCYSQSKATKNAILSEKLLFESILPISSFIFLVETQSYNDKKVKEIIKDIVVEGMHFMMSKKIGEVKEDDSNESEQNCVCGKIIKGSKELENGETLGDHVEHVLNCGCVDPKIEPSNESELSELDSDNESTKNENSNTKKTNEENELNLKTKDRISNTSNAKTDEKNPDMNKKNVTTKNEVLELLDLYSNFSMKIDAENKKLKAALQKRNTIFESDKSQISKMLCIDEIRKMKTQVKMLDENKIKKY